MKTKLYLYGCVLSAAVLLSASGNVFSQCNCPGGVAATKEPDNVQVMYPTTASSYTLSFPKFDPTIGTLSCITLAATLQGKSTSTGNITWTNNTAEIAEFFWQKVVTPKITFPSGENFGKTYIDPYGPDTLATQPYIDSVNALPDPTKHVTYGTSATHGPKDLFVDAYLTRTTNNTVAFIGNPNTYADINYSIFGTFGPIAGSINYGVSTSTTTSGSFRLSYYWCPTAVLAKSIRNFTAKLDDDKNTINVKWTAENQAGGVVYEVQVSNDGVNYKTVYTQPAQVNGNSNIYQFQYNIQSGSSDLVFMRIKQTDANGKVTYTTINKVNINELRMGTTMSIYPNPAVNTVALQFQDVMNGDFAVDVINLTGQTIFSKGIRISNSKTAPVDFNNSAKSGVYYLRATDKRTGISYVNKLFIK